jgi:hypothetical protein
MTDEIEELLHEYNSGQDDLPAGRARLVSSRLKAYHYVFYYHSAYAEVRESVPNTDDPSLPCETFRAYFLGLFFVALFAGVNQVRTVLSSAH